MSTDVRAKALGYLRDGRVTVSAATFAGLARVPYDVLAYVDGYRSTYIVRLVLDTWACSCATAGCPHVAAVQLVTGHPSVARKDAEAKDSAVLAEPPARTA
ncbi:hypothetical protein [Actinoallomurus sp. NPDC052274]|uniref:hypothetical protein n=1 Tax=Actinoallomurus sp. NPDC052274 TaxID=3155420 RepID=UPI00342B16DE